MPNDTPSLRDTIESAMNAGAEPVPDTAAVAESPDLVAAEPVSSTTETDTRSAADRARDDAGKFVKTDKPATDKAAPAGKGAEKAAPPVVAQGKPAGAAPPTSPAPAGEPAAQVAPVKAPQSWKPAVRELAAKLPAEFRPILEESIRVDNEAKRALNDSAQARQFASQVQQTLAPFEGLARANGMDSVKYAGSVMQTAAALHMGTPQQKASIVAQLIGTYGIDVDVVNAVMQGQAPQAAQHQAQSPVDVNRAVEEEFSRRMQTAVESRAQTAWQEFQATEPEFLTDAVKDSMRLIIEHEAARGRNVTYQQAYDRACQLDEEVSGVLTQRKSAEALRAQAPTVQRAKVAGSSIKAAPSATGVRPGTAGRSSLRETIESAINGQRT